MSLEAQKSLILMKSNLLKSFDGLYFWCHSSEIFAYSRVVEIFFYFFFLKLMVYFLHLHVFQVNRMYDTKFIFLLVSVQ